MHGLTLCNPYNPAIPLLSIYSKKTITQKDMCTPIFIAALFTIAKKQKQHKGIDKEDVIHVHNEIILSHKK